MLTINKQFSTPKQMYLGNSKSYPWAFFVIISDEYADFIFSFRENVALLPIDGL